MPDDKSQIGGPDRARVSEGDGYEVRYFAAKHGLSVETAEKLIREHGHSRAVLDREAEKLKKH